MELFFYFQPFFFDKGFAQVNRGRSDKWKISFETGESGFGDCIGRLTLMTKIKTERYYVRGVSSVFTGKFEFGLG